MGVRSQSGAGVGRWPSRGIALVALLVALSATLPATASARNIYVGHVGVGAGVSVIDTAGNAVLPAPIPFSFPGDIAITPDGAHVYVTNAGSFSVIDTATNAVVAGPIPLAGAGQIAISPDGTRAYFTTTPSSVSVIDTATNTLVGDPIPIGGSLTALAITPDGSRVYVAEQSTHTVRVIDTATNTVVGDPISVPNIPFAIAITPDGTKVFVVSITAGRVSVIDAATNTVLPNPFIADPLPTNIAITPDGTRAYVPYRDTGNVFVVNTTTNAAAAGPINVGDVPQAIAVTPDGTRAFTANEDTDDVSLIDTATNSVLGNPTDVGDKPRLLAIVPNQGPIAAFSAAPAAPGTPTAFDAAATTDSDGTIARHDWDFGDGTTLSNGGAIPHHIYATPGDYTVTLTVTDNEGCSTAFIFTGQTAHCNGGAKARVQHQVSAQFPDETAPTLKLKGKRTQRFGAAVALDASCDEACEVNGAGRLILVIKASGGKSRQSVRVKRRSFKLRSASVSLASGETETLRLKLPSKARKLGKRALSTRPRGKAVARLQFTASDASGNESTARRTVSLVASAK